VKKQREQDNYRKFGVLTMYFLTVVSAEWLETAGAVGALGQFAVPLEDDVQAKMSTVHSVPSRPSSRNSRRRSRFSTPCSPTPHTPESITFPGHGEVFKFPGDEGFYAWLTDDQFDFLKVPKGQQSLVRWLSELHSCASSQLPVEVGPGHRIEVAGDESQVD